MRYEMILNLRLNKYEQEKIREKSIEINKKLISKNKQPVKESELLHVLLKKTIKKLYVNENGEIDLDI